MAVKVLFGDEPYYIDMNVAQIKKDIQEMNISVYEEINDNLISDIDSAPIFDNRRVVILIMDELKDNGILQLIDNVPEYVDFVVIAKEVDKRTAIYKALKSKNVLVECSKLSEAQLKKFIFIELNKHNAKITNMAYHAMLERVNYFEDADVTLYTILIYIKQLALLNSVITEKEVKKVIPSSSNEKAFELSKALLIGRDDRVFALALNFLERGENVISMLSLLQRLFRLGFKSALLTDVDKTELAALLGAPLFQFEEAMKYSKETLSRVLDVIQEAINGIKTGRCEKENMFLLSLCKILQLLRNDKGSEINKIASY